MKKCHGLNTPKITPRNESEIPGDFGLGNPVFQKDLAEKCHLDIVAPTSHG